MADLVQLRSRVDVLRARYDRAKETLSREKDDLKVKQKLILSIQAAQEITQHVAQAIQSKAYERISMVVSSCLASVFDNPYEFMIRFDRKRIKTEAVLTFVRDGCEFDDPKNEISGGVIDVAAFALRVAFILCSKPVRRRLLVLDEPFTNVRGRGNRQRVRKMMIQLAEKMGFQFVLNVDEDAYPEFALGKIIRMGE